MIFVMTLAGVMGGLGFINLLVRRTLLGVLIGVHLIVLGATMFFVFAGLSANVAINGFLFGVFIALSGVAQIVVGYALAVRMFYLKHGIGMDALRALKR